MTMTQAPMIEHRQAAALTAAAERMYDYYAHDPEVREWLEFDEPIIDTAAAAREAEQREGVG